MLNKIYYNNLIYDFFIKKLNTNETKFDKILLFLKQNASHFKV
jgi:hypothetical protein